MSLVTIGKNNSRQASFIASSISDIRGAHYYLCLRCCDKENQMQIIPPALVGAARGAILSQGGNPNLIDNNGELSADGVLELFFNQAEVRTALSPPLIFPIGPTGIPADPASDLLVRQLRPTVILSGPAGRVEIAPYGESAGASSWWPLALGAGAVVLTLGWLWYRR